MVENIALSLLPIDISLLTQTIYPDLIMTNGRNAGPKTYKGTNIFFLGSSNTKIMIDAGEDVPEYEESLNKIFDTFNISISHVIITHFHHDHTDGIQYVLKRFPSVIIYKFKGDGESLKSDENLQNKFGFKYTYLKNEEIINLDEYELKIIHLPGHSDDSIGIYDSKKERLFIGDTVLGDGTGTQITNLTLYMKSLEKILEMEIECLLPAHGNILLKKESVKKHVMIFFENRRKRELSILEVLKQHKRLEYD